MLILRARHDGQIPLPLHENATGASWPQSWQTTLTKPWVRAYYASLDTPLFIRSRRSRCFAQSAEDTSILQHCRLPTTVRTALSLPDLTN
jgi:hypothetical protein